MIAMVVKLHTVHALVYIDGKVPESAHSDEWAEEYAKWLRAFGHSVAVIHLTVDPWCQTCGAIDGVTRPVVPSRCTNEHCADRHQTNVIHV